MRAVIRRQAVDAYGQECQSTDISDRSVQRPVKPEPIYFRDLARMAWPEKSEQHLSFITGVDPRTCRRWLAGDNEPPAEALGVVLAEIMRRFHQR